MRTHAIAWLLVFKWRGSAVGAHLECSHGVPGAMFDLSADPRLPTGRHVSYDRWTERRFSADWSQLIVHGHWLVSLLGVRRIEPVLHTDVDTKSHQCSVLPSKRHLSKVSRGTGRSRVLTARRRRISATAFTKRLQCKCKDPRTGLCLTMPRYPRPETHCVRKTSWDTPFSRPPRARSLSQSRLPSNAL